MTPFELEAIRERAAINTLGERIQWDREDVPRLLAHIAAQAEEIAGLKTALSVDVEKLAASEAQAIRGEHRPMAESFEELRALSVLRGRLQELIAKIERRAERHRSGQIPPSDFTTDQQAAAWAFDWCARELAAAMKGE